MSKSYYEDKMRDAEDAKERIERFQHALDMATETIERQTAEIDALKAQCEWLEGFLRGGCDYCKHKLFPSQEEPCFSCLQPECEGFELCARDALKREGE